MTEPRKRECVFGPVPSRRLGLSLGVDLVSRKVCTLDCIYCQVGRTTDRTTRRADFVPLDDVLDEIRDALDRGPRPDYVTMSGSGEPTLNVRLGELIDRIRRITDIPVAVITNGTLLADPDVRRDCAKADLVAPSLDAADEETYQAINRPAPGLTLERLVDGLAAFRREFSGRYWLEVFIAAGVNDSDEHALRLKPLIDRINPDRVQINTATRPPADADVRAVSPERLDRIARLLGPRAQVIADFRPRGPAPALSPTDEQVLQLIMRRPVTADDIAAGLAAHPAEVAKALGRLVESGKIVGTRRAGRTFFEPAEKP